MKKSGFRNRHSFNTSDIVEFHTCIINDSMEKGTWFAGFHDFSMISHVSPTIWIRSPWTTMFGQQNFSLNLNYETLDKLLFLSQNYSRLLKYFLRHFLIGWNVLENFFDFIEWLIEQKTLSFKYIKREKHPVQYFYRHDINFSRRFVRELLHPKYWEKNDLYFYMQISHLMSHAWVNIQSWFSNCLNKLCLTTSLVGSLQKFAIYSRNRCLRSSSPKF